MVESQALAKFIPVTSVEVNNNESNLPGDLAMWMFIVMELTVFALFFFGFAIAQRFNSEMFIAGRATLHTSLGLTCTISLLISSYFVAMSVIRIKQLDKARAKKMLLIALIFSWIYLASKIVEYIYLIQKGYDLSTNTFYTLYFFTTFFHFMHVLLGIVILCFMLKRISKNDNFIDNFNGFESGACYWHMVDLVWIILFFLIYIAH